VSKTSDDLLYVCEFFASIQGEGSYSGYPCFFIRLSGCNLRCCYCDTKYAFARGDSCQIKALVAAWQKSRIPLVLITGGEPLLQPAVYRLMENLLHAGATCLLETNGSLNVARVPRKVIKILDWKTPGSGEGRSFRLENLKFLSPKDQIKFVIVSRTDYEWVLNTARNHFLHNVCEVLLSPASGDVHPRELAAWMLEDRPVARMQIQLHRLLWGDRKGI